MALRSVDQSPAPRNDLRWCADRTGNARSDQSLGRGQRIPRCPGGLFWNEVGQIASGVSTAALNIAKDATAYANPFTMANQAISTIQSTASAYQEGGVGLAVNQFNPVYQALELGSATYDQFKAGCYEVGAENLTYLSAAVTLRGRGKGVHPRRTGIYVSETSRGNVYVGQSNNVDRRLEEHVEANKFTPNQASAAAFFSVSGGKLRREIAEQRMIERLGGVENLENVNNPIGPLRRHLMKLVPRNKDGL
ncbi:GIY-YIG nuclease family protein [Kineosporia sp. J2-2]|uniref:GIY-YIG nuclease family protein n=1 Tax=Kineosporia corallincola TaxID=2835133 RepID=A0ABS5TTW0_9ACTN|nr:GIY-YIG nuclease family protein [Kineosporia corallincola]MBT0774218.1 GIY-YIG nuclease family protein [Kineosporia corallincola]